MCYAEHHVLVCGVCGAELRTLATTQNKCFEVLRARRRFNGCGTYGGAPYRSTRRASRPCRRCARDACRREEGLLLGWGSGAAPTIGGWGWLGAWLCCFVRRRR